MTMSFNSINHENKTSETETHFFFLNGPLSQWHPCEFVCPLFGSEEVMRFNCAEQYMMACKAELFVDTEALAKIMATGQEKDWRNAPKKQKAIGRNVQGFVVERWARICRQIALAGNTAKFAQNAALADYLMNTKNKILVESAHYDQVWGVGLAWNDEQIIDPANWTGTNWLGEALMQVRANLQG
jgi:ribA/ribD-fused uncharacterized protein